MKVGRPPLDPFLRRLAAWSILIGIVARFWIENLAWYEVVGQKRSDEDLSEPVWEYVRQDASADPSAVG
ncbi:hypothetical protein [Micromonospora sp. NPDC023644]|uniref:hypothetical protein n=1 Tax=Micromonospora sp. NPDC023644 TaxID=3154321 RepID=UPI0033E09FC9